MNEQQVETPSIPLTRRFTYGFTCGVIGGLIGLVTNIATGQGVYGGIMGILIGASIGGYIIPEIVDWFHAHVELPERLHRRIRPSAYQQEGAGDEVTQLQLPMSVADFSKTAVLGNSTVDPIQEEDEPLPEEELFFSGIVLNKEPPFQRLTQAQVLAHSKLNDFNLWVGQSVKKQPKYVKKINFRKRHWKVIGGTQGGKSTLNAFTLDTIFKTHDTDHVQAAILDLEDRTGKLFEDDPHIASIMRNGKEIKLHARNVKEVFEYLGYVYTIMVERYKLSLEECEQLPTLLVYFEEFKAFRDKLKAAMNIGSTEQREQAKRDYLTFMNRFQQIVQQGLKVYVQLIVCSQVEYRDEDLVDAFANLLHGFAFCIKPTAGAAAGFLQNGLLTENARAKLQGQCVMEFPEGDDIILVPEFDIIELALAKQQQKVKKTSFLIEINDDEKAIPMRKQSIPQKYEDDEYVPSQEQSQEEYAAKPPLDEDLYLKGKRLYNDMGYTTLDGFAVAMGAKSASEVRMLWTRLKMEKQQVEAVS